MELVDGRAIARKIINQLKQDVEKDRLTGTLAIIVVSEDSATKSFLKQKTKISDELGFGVKIFEFSKNIKEEELRGQIQYIVDNMYYQGVIVQLPLPPHINVQGILDLVPPEKDIDVLSSKRSPELISPIVCAVLSVLKEYNIDFKGKTMAIVGKGRLVGRPLINWFSKQSVKIIEVDEYTENPHELVREADIVISGVGKSGLITDEWVKHGAVVIDAGTSESKGSAIGDVDVESVQKKATLITPVPGGVGPITVSCLWKNFVEVLK